MVILACHLELVCSKDDEVPRGVELRFLSILSLTQLQDLL